MFFGIGIPKKVALKAQPLGFGLTPKELNDYINEFKIDVQGERIDPIELDCAANLHKCKKLYLKYGEYWYNYYTESAYMFKHFGGNFKLRSWNRDNFESDHYPPLHISPKTKAELVALRDNPVEDLDEELQLVKKEYFTDGVINIYCKKCRTTIDADLARCPHPAREKYYKVRIYATGTKKSLTSRNVAGAINEAIALKHATADSLPSSIKKVEYLHEAVPLFLRSMVADADDPKKPRMSLTVGHIKEMARHCKVLQDIFARHGKRTVRLTAFENEDIGLLLFKTLKETLYTEEYIKQNQRIANKKVGDRLWGGKTIDKMATTWSSLLIYVNKHHKQDLYNPFALWQNQAEIPEPKAIPDSKFKALLAFMDTKPEIKVSGTVKINTDDLTWLRRAYLMEYWFGCRREDAVTVTWKALKNIEGFYLFEMPNLKRTRRAKSAKVLTDEHVVTTDMLQEIKAWGIGDNDEYIILPQEKDQRRMDRLQDQISKGFTVLGKMAFGKDWELKNKSLKKGAVTDGADVHKDARTAVKYYTEAERKALNLAKQLKDAAKA